MVNAERLLEDLKKLRKKLEADLRDHHASSAGRAAIEAEWQEARDTRRTADTFETFFGAAVDQAAVHWILALVFLRFLEDNGLLDRPLISGPGERSELRPAAAARALPRPPEDSDPNTCWRCSAQVAQLPGLRGLYDPVHNPLFRLPVSATGRSGCVEFFTRSATRDRGAGARLHRPGLGHPLSRRPLPGPVGGGTKRYALLQTPEFVEEFILDRTLDPAIREFGLDEVRLIDPTCGSGHFLLGGFHALLAEWQRHEPGRRRRGAGAEGAGRGGRRGPQSLRRGDRALPSADRGAEGVRRSSA